MTGKRWAYEDFEVGSEIRFGPREVTAEEMIEFAREFDPQPMHVDETAGKASILGQLSASGLFSASIFMRMMCEAYVLDSTSQGSPGLDEVNFRKPLFAGETVTGRTVILDKRVSKSRPGLGFVTVRSELLDRNGEVIMDLHNTGMFLMRDPEAA